MSSRLNGTLVILLDKLESDIKLLSEIPLFVKYDFIHKLSLLNNSKLTGS